MSQELNWKFLRTWFWRTLWTMIGHIVHTKEGKQPTGPKNMLYQDLSWIMSYIDDKRFGLHSCWSAYSIRVSQYGRWIKNVYKNFSFHLNYVIFLYTSKRVHHWCWVGGKHEINIMLYRGLYPDLVSRRATCTKGSATSPVILTTLAVCGMAIPTWQSYESMRRWAWPSNTEVTAPVMFRRRAASVKSSCALTTPSLTSAVLVGDTAWYECFERKQKRTLELELEKFNFTHANKPAFKVHINKLSMLSQRNTGTTTVFGSGFYTASQHERKKENKSTLHSR